MKGKTLHLGSEEDIEGTMNLSLTELSFFEMKRYSLIIKSLVFILQYFPSPVFMTVSIVVNKLDNCSVVQLLVSAVK